MWDEFERERENINLFVMSLFKIFHLKFRKKITEDVGKNHAPEFKS